MKKAMVQTLIFEHVVGMLQERHSDLEILKRNVKIIRDFRGG